MEVFWGAKSDTPEKRVAFDPSSRFHSAEGRSRLAQIAGQAKKDAVIQMNFLSLVRMLFHGATPGPGSFQSDHCRTLVEDEEFVQLVWEAALAQPLNPRIVGSLREQLLKVEGANIDLPTLERPVWWTVIEDALFPSSSDTDHAEAVDDDPPAIP